LGAYRAIGAPIRDERAITPVFGLAWAFIAHTDSRFEPEMLHSIALEKFIDIALGILQADDRQLFRTLGFALSKFHECTLEKRVVLILLELSETFGIRDKQGGVLPENHREYRVGSFTDRRRTNEGEPIQRRTDHRDSAGARSGGQDRRGVPAARDLGRDLLQMESQVWRHGGVGREAA
jgi:hypothetical protein